LNVIIVELNGTLAKSLLKSIYFSPIAIKPFSKILIEQLYWKR